MPKTDRPRLKDSDEILDSLGRSRISPNMEEASSSPNRGQAESKQQSPRSTRRRRSSLASSASLSGDDGGLLDFDRFKLPDDSLGTGGQSLEAFVAQAVLSDASILTETTLSESRKSSAARKSVPTKKESGRTGSAPKQPAPTFTDSQHEDDMSQVSEYQFENFDGNAPLKNSVSKSVDGSATVSEQEQSPEKRPASKRRSAVDRKSAGQPEVEPIVTESSDSKKQTSYSEKKPEDPRRALVEDPDYRDNYMERIANEFEREFSEKFGGDSEVSLLTDPQSTSSSQLSSKPENPAQWFDVTPKQETKKPFLDLFDSGDPSISLPENEIDPEADSFLEQFAEAVRGEESEQSESFKDTLSEKFMRERERYLRELGIERDPQEIKPSLEPSAKRKRLDFQIRPEMHIQDGDSPTSAAITYDRDASTRSLEEMEREPLRTVPPPLNFAQGGKRSSEELIQELAHQVEEAQEKISWRSKKRESFSHVPPNGESAGKPEKKQTLAIIGVTMVLTLALVAGATTVIRNITDLTSQVKSSDEPVQAANGDTVVIYESRTPETRVVCQDAVIKRPNLSVSNYTVEKHLIIEDIEASGTIYLEDVAVGGNIYLRSSELDALHLKDVVADRVIVNNTQKAMTITIEGNSDITTIEVKSPATLKQSEIGGDMPGVGGVIAENADDSATLEVVMDGLVLRTLSTSGDTVLNMRETSVETVSSEGSLSMHGEGKVFSLSVATGGDKPLSVLLKGVTISNMNIKSPGTFNLSTNIDALALSDPANIGGNGNVATMTINEKFGNSRLLVDLAGIHIQTLIGNAEARLNLEGSAQINNLIANASTYVIGNKVNYLQVNNNRVIYENEPDRIETKPGIRPPETVADNPNLDFSLPTVRQNGPVDTSGDMLSTTCGHPRESGGFLAGDGSREKPFEVQTVSQLAHIVSHMSSHFQQTSDIDCADDSTFSGIGAPDNPFLGVYDGSGFDIRNLKISSGSDSLGLFAENSGEIRYVFIASGDIRSTATSRAYVGGITGVNLEDGLIFACSNGARVATEDASYAGGIVGYNYGGRIRDCYNTARIADAAHAGGIVGMNRSGGGVARCYSVGTVTGDMAEGGIAGTNEGGTVTNSYFLEDSVPNGIGAGEGSANRVSESTLRSSQMVADLAAGNDTSPWTLGSTSGGYSYPILSAPSAFVESSSEQS